MVQGIPRQGGRRRRQPTTTTPTNDQPQAQPVIQRLSFSKMVGKVVTGAGWLIRAGVILFLLIVMLEIGSCTLQVVQWGRDKSKEFKARNEVKLAELEKEFAKKDAGIGEKAESEVVTEERRESDKLLSDNILTWLCICYAPEWRNLSLELPDSTPLRFPIIPYAGTHVPPFDLTLAPKGTKLLFHEEGVGTNGLLRIGREFSAVYEGAKYASWRHDSVVIVKDSPETPRFVLKSDHPDKSRGLASNCLFTVQYPSDDKAQEDKQTRLVLERTFWKDFDCPVKIMDLPPPLIGDVPVAWNLVVRVSPAILSDPSTGIGRWTPSSALGAEYRSLFPPTLQIREKGSVGKDVVWEDDEGLLRSGRFFTSADKLIQRVNRWRARRGSTAVKLQKGDQLYIVVKSFPDRSATEIIPVGVMVRVILRVRRL